MGNCNTCKAQSEQQKTQIVDHIEEKENMQPVKAHMAQPEPQTEKNANVKESLEGKTKNQSVKEVGHKRRGKAAFLVDQEVQNVKDNVTFLEKEIEQGDIEEIKKTLKNHFVFSQLPDKEIQVVIKSMRSCMAHKGNYIFKQNDVASSYYIILEGSCMVEIDGVEKRKLIFGGSFGDLGIIYQAPRSASVRALEDCQFVEIGRNEFRKVTEEINSMYEAENKQFLKILTFYDELTEDQKNAIASTCLTETYEEGQVIFTVGDAANSIYIIKKGRVLIREKNLQLGERECFGENCILSEKPTTRSNTLVAKSCLQMISISRQSIMSNLGDNLRNTLKRNIITKLLKESPLYKAQMKDQWARVIEQASIIEFKAGEVVIKKGTLCKNDFYAVITADIKNSSKTYAANSIIELNKVQEGEQIVFNEDLRAQKDGQIFRISRINSKVKEVQSGQNEQIKGLEKKMMISDFYVVRELRSGNFGQVYACYNKQTAKLYAIKVLERSAVQKDHLIQYIMNEEEILRTAPTHPFLINFYKLIKDTNFIYFIMDFIAGEDMFDVMSKVNIFDEKKARFIASQILLLLQHLHSSRIIYRDLKPQNLMMGTNGYLTLVDMGTAKRLKIERRYRTKTIIGTPHYMAPEIILGKGYTFQVDLWSFGVLLYEMLCGRLPFGELSEDPFTIYEEVMSGTLKYPRTCPKAGKLFIEKLLSKNPQQRLGSGYEELKKNNFFTGIDWQDILNKEVKPVYLPDNNTAIYKEEIDQVVRDPNNKGNQKFLAMRSKKEQS